MQILLGKNHFEVFQLPIRFDVDQGLISERYRELQKTLHPDKFVNASDQEQRLSMQQTALVNESFQVLKSPLLRAKYLLELKGVNFSEKSEQLDPAFLMEQLELREAIENISEQEDPFGSLTEIQSHIEQQVRDMIENLRANFESDQDDLIKYTKEMVLKLQFLQKLLSETERLEDTLVHEL
jgi:molecular chaperone HscB